MSELAVLYFVLNINKMTKQKKICRCHVALAPALADGLKKLTLFYLQVVIMKIN